MHRCNLLPNIPAPSDSARLPPAAPPFQPFPTVTARLRLTAAAPASAPRAGASRDHGLGSAQASPMKSPTSPVQPHSTSPWPPGFSIVHTPRWDLPRLLSLLSPRAPLKIPLARPHPPPGRASGSPGTQLPVLAQRQPFPAPWRPSRLLASPSFVIVPRHPSCTIMPIDH